jgi:ferredoxin
MSSDITLIEQKCPSCGQCVAICPTAGLQAPTSSESNATLAEDG